MLNTLRLWNCVGFCGIIGRCQSVSPYPLPLQGPCGMWNSRLPRLDFQGLYNGGRNMCDQYCIRIGNGQSNARIRAVG